MPESLPWFSCWLWEVEGSQKGKVGAMLRLLDEDWPFFGVFRLSSLCIECYQRCCFCAYSKEKLFKIWSESFSKSTLE